MIGEDPVLKQTAAWPYQGASLENIEAKESYFLQLGARVATSVFQSDVDRLILTMAADGAKIKHITEALEQRGTRRCRMTVRMTIRKYEVAWGLRQWTAKQLNKKAPQPTASSATAVAASQTRDETWSSPDGLDRSASVTTTSA